MNRLGICLLFSFALLNKVTGQSIPSEELQKTAQTRYISISSQNDIFQVFNNSDKYFTNGISVELAHRIFNNPVARAILLKNKGNYKSEYALSLSQHMYTPADLSKSEVDSSDRPYCGLLYFAYTRHSNNSQIGRKIVSRLFVGVTGPMAGASDFQYLVHNTLPGNEAPQGWDNQIANGLLLDYEVRQQRILPFKARYVEFNTDAMAHVGTIYNFVQTGLTTKFGWFNYSYYQFNGLFNSKSPQGTYQTEDLRWSKKKRERKPLNAKSRTTRINRDFQLYSFVNLNFGYMIYDGTVHGSLIPFGPSPYTMQQRVINPANGSLVYGLTFNYRSFLFQFERVEKWDVYKGEGFYGWGQFRLTFSI
jgi:hypothetical protein